jgi:aerobic-type carbon monoxide dehydrogenase small subunit (CoxS/CutS family)
MDETYAMTVNGQRRTVKTDSQRMLLDVLREDLQLTGTKYGCGEARCGACTVLVDGKRVYSCRTRIADADGKAVLTIEGLAQGDKLHRVQQAFLAENGFQCGFCTAGMIMSAVALLEETPSPSDAEIRSWMNRQMCRCCSYLSIVDAVRHAAGARS